MKILLFRLIKEIFCVELYGCGDKRYYGIVYVFGELIYFKWFLYGYMR